MCTNRVSDKIQLSSRKEDILADYPSFENPGNNSCAFPPTTA